MPFGFEGQLKKEREEAKISTYNNENHYLDVIATMTTEGKIYPISFIWDDGREYNILRVLETKTGKELKLNTACKYRFLIQTRMKRFYMYFDGKRWYVDFW